MSKKTIAFLFGAGAEGENQYNLPMGGNFKKDTIYGKKVNEFASLINKDYELDNETIIKHNSTSILYQTLKEKSELIKDLGLSENDIQIITNYMYYKSNSAKQNDGISKQFYDLYRRLLYNEITKEDNTSLPDYTNKLLNNISFYIFIDSLFNCLRFPDMYKDETKKVIKAYFSAYKSIYESLISNLSNDKLEHFYVDKGKTIFEKRYELIKLLDESYKKIVVDNADKNTYYNIVKKLKEKYNVKVVTTNYTEICEKSVGLFENDIAYIHGNLKLFENIENKDIKILTDFKPEDKVFPFIFIQSGIKPIVSPCQIEELEKSRKFIIDSDYFIVNGYGINSDDEHINSMIRKRINDNKITIIFVYNKTEKEIERILKNLHICDYKSNLTFFDCLEFKNYIVKEFNI